ncbi:nicotinate-nucleotide adenylyltransferase [Pseudooceanicola algae]|uniref:Probable nicotinate-nucleotide adenylyltransferase n=1 Tax=Pseudooceanicola algae TaxID=1537215 RepID=A0A418SJF2_9RHOB|nr:nicotinate-nucleotide adenylyltransferase [Pseudooceanicola algae]QPM91866.1 nicotinate-nucleotide adenylyltransferase [Pseudooceanicola algae]
MVQKRPLALPGQRIGLLGGSFDPPHEGHRHITLEALKRFDLDAVWWLVSPGNPLKPHGPAPMQARLAAGRALMQHPRVHVTGIEARTGTRYTAETLRALKGLYPGTGFIWLMGADNLVQIDRWQEWRWIMNNVPVGVLARPGERLAARESRAARIYRGARLNERDSRLLGRHGLPQWCFVNVPLVAASSSRIRETGGWKVAEERSDAPTETPPDRGDPAAALGARSPRG